MGVVDALSAVLPGLILGGHYALLILLSLYGAHRLYHLAVWRHVFREAPMSPDAMALDQWPMVTVQLPVFNEKFVVARLLDQVSKLDYPADRLQIQLVDDSDDESTGIAAQAIEELRLHGVAIEHVRRPDRTGFKAGGLDYAMRSATGEFIAIFDADFMPQPDFLKRTIPVFTDTEIGMVQARWTYLNREQSLLTRVEALMLDAHFAVEQMIRSRSGAYFNFNGTGGVWRRTAIEDAGGWQADTLTEDMDLSYRAQMRGWRFAYRGDVECPSELPSDVAAFKTQQHRWAKGAVQVMKKVLPPLWRSKASLHIKVEATFHLSGNICYILMLIDSLFFLMPSVYLREDSYASAWLWLDIPILIFASLSHGIYYLCAQRRLGHGVLRQMVIMPVVFAASIGLGVNNSRAVIEAIVGHETGFVRTPKVGGTVSEVGSSKPQAATYQALRFIWVDRLELLLGLLFTLFIGWSLARGQWLALPFLSVFALGYLSYGFASMRLDRSKQKPLTLQKARILEEPPLIEARDAPKHSQDHTVSERVF